MICVERRTKVAPVLGRARLIPPMDGDPNKEDREKSLNKLVP
jgi:hypothetical protein